ncbi:MAG TPA: zinc-binding alcohol dehydrogenase family protein [Gammaproteobacteria bacterium]|nr:zinc-binding alcohol dehydrogenase family protein [Gammaproteobacteria bacterium]
MQAIGFSGGKSLDDADAFARFTCEIPSPTGHDLRVAVQAVSVNPVDTKVRAGIRAAEQPPRILGWDAAGVVESVGDAVTLFKPGDRVFYAGDIQRPGSNATHQLVDERIVGNMPATLDFMQAASLPLTAITAWEALFSRLRVDHRSSAGKRLLVIGGAGGVGSIAIQLAKQVAGLEIIATASRDASRDWCISLGADHVVNHHTDMAAAFRKQDIAAPDYILCLNSTDAHFPAMVELIAPQGLICSIVGTAEAHNFDVLKSKSAGFIWEFMFTRPVYRTADMQQQHELLNEVARLVDAGTLRSTLQTVAGPLTPDNLRAAHRQLESGSMIGKLVLGAIE